MIRRKQSDIAMCIMVSMLIMISNSAYAFRQSSEIITLELSELIVSEAIVIDDEDEDLSEAIDGSETDYVTVSGKKSSNGNSGNIKTDLPAFYTSDQVDERDYVTPVRNQGYTALCWAYAALGAVESDILLHHSDMKVDELNLSEKHCAYYNMHRAYGSVNGGIDGDYREFSIDENDKFLGVYDTSYFSVGGVTDYCLSLFSSWKGPVADTDSNSIHALKGQNELYTQNADVPTDAYENPVCHVQNIYEIPATEKNRDIIKRMIMEHGSVTASVNSSDSYWTGKKVALYDYKKHGDGNFADHEVLIVGWNDDYPAKNFITKPKTDGAFICRNSWGTSKGASGYFYLSYEDSILTNNNVVAYSSAMPSDDDWYDNNYQYAGFITHVMDPIVDQKNVVYMYDKNDARYAITITPTKDETLSAIGYFSMSTNTNDKLCIYELPQKSVPDIDAKDLADAINKLDEESLANLAGIPSTIDLSKLDKPLVTMNCKAITGGFHTFSLENPVEIKAGNDYLIVIKPGKKTKLVYEKAMDKMTDPHRDEWQHNLGALHTVNTASGHSYLQDISGNVMIKQTDKDFFIKAYTKDK